ncbi:nuclear receptor coactivator 5 [Sparganum proliferum]
MTDRVVAVVAQYLRLVCRVPEHFGLYATTIFVADEDIQLLCLFVPLRLRTVSSGVVRWYFYEKHCLFQITYVLLVLIAHLVLIRDVLPLLYTYAWTENHILVGFMCLFANIGMYLAVCLKDPGVVTSSRAAFYSSTYEYDNVIYRPVLCPECAFVRPPRTKHCYRCDHCVHRFDHHCVWTNSCVGSGNHVTFLGYLLSFLAMTFNASYLCLRAIRLHVQATRLWEARYIDEAGKQHPMCLGALVQHLLLSQPLVVCFCSILLLLDLLLLGYLIFHLFLALTNQTTYERYWRSERRSGKLFSRDFYNLGLVCCLSVFNCSGLLLMRSRFDNGSSKPPQDVECMGKVVIRNIRIRFVSDDSLRVWLDKYGKIEETKIYSNCAVVKFASDLEAAGAVQCEDGIRRFGSIASVKHAEPEILRALERSEPFRVADYQGSAASSSSESRSRRRHSPSGDNDSSRSHKRSNSPRNSSSQSRKNAKGSSTSSKDSHPLTWLSEAAEKSSGKQQNSAGRTKPESESKNPPTSDDKVARPYEVAVLAITHDLVPYAEAVQGRIAALSGSAILKGCAPPRSHIMVLVSIDHLTPCIQDLTNDGVLYAVIVNGPNWTHCSCILRILHSATQQEHRNMPLSDAITLLAKDYSTHVGSISSVPTATPQNPPRDKPPQHQPAPSNPTTSQPPAPSHSAAPPQPAAPSHSVAGAGAVESFSEAAPDPDDPAFIKPSRHVATLLRMLADSRVLSVGELDELAAFIAERRARLTSQYTSSLPGAATSTTAALKSRILDMLYPNQKQGQQQPQDQPTAQHGNAPALSAPYAQPSAASQEQLVSKLNNPSVQQALNNLLKTSQSASPVSQPTVAVATGPTPLFPKGGPNQVTQMSASTAWQDWGQNTATATANWPPSTSSSFERDNNNVGYGQQHPTRWGEQPYASAGDKNDSGQHYDSVFNSLAETDTKPPWLSSRGSKRSRASYKKKFSKRQQEYLESLSPPPSFGQQKFPRNENPAQTSRFVLPPQVVPGDSGVSSSRPPYSTQSLSTQGDAAAIAAAAAAAEHYKSLAPGNPTYATQHYGGPGAPPGAPSFTLPAEPAPQPKDWSTYGSGYGNY